MSPAFRPMPRHLAPAVTGSLILTVGMLALGLASAAMIVPTEIQQPGTQPGEVSNLETPDKCDNCHGGYNE